MAGEKELLRAKKTYETLCSLFDRIKLHYVKNESELRIDSIVRGDDLPIEFSIEVDADRQLVSFVSMLPYTVSEDKRLDIAVAVSVVNNRLVDGSFAYNIKSGRLFFIMTNSFFGSGLSEGVFMYMFTASGTIIDKYNDQFLLISKNALSLEKFING